MDAKVRVQLGRTWLEVDASSVKDAVAKLAPYYEVFGENYEVFGEKACGRCQSEDIAPEHRQHDGHDYYAMRCRSCGAQLDFGQHRGGETLFAKRKTASGEYDSAHHGWYRWKDRQG